ncbi:MAG: phosphomethylpyrimidine synthase ThiC [Actinomycetota bacterium]|nr:phosphomethylpyrimidine synthase ThiC [Actinomycetota bacterium]
MTLIERIKAGDVPKSVEELASEEGVALDRLCRSVIEGRVVVPRNVNRTMVRSIGIGEGLRTKVNANIGTSEDYPFLKEELEKLKVAVATGADAVMDLSTGGDLREIRREILSHASLPVGTVPIYQAAVDALEKYGSIVEMTVDHLFGVIEEHAKDGVDFATVHCGITREALNALVRQKRVMDVVSRGGAFVVGWMIHNEKENPLYKQFDRLLEIARRYDLTLSLGDGMRPGCLADASDGAQIQELVTLGRLVERAREAQVQVMVEGPGHLPLDHIEANMRMAKSICKGAPFYVLGPLVTDVAPDYDHISSAIGGALAAWAGADFLCYVTPREHLGLPTVGDVREGVIASRIAAHAADIAKGVPGAKDWDLEMARARKALDWQKEIELAIDPEKARRAYEERKVPNEETCTMCGEFCAMKLVGEFLGSDRGEKC